METLRLKKVLTDKRAQTLKSKFYDLPEGSPIITADADGYDLATGKMLFRFRKNVLTGGKEFYELMKGAVSASEGRGTASGGSFKRVRKDGTVSNTTVGTHVDNGIVGYFDPSGHFPYCRRTAFTRDHFDKWEAGLFYPQQVDKVFKELVPERWNMQNNMARATNKNYVIPGTTFTTITINRNFRTAVHQDAGDYTEGFGNLSVYREGDWSGGYFCLPQWQVGIDVRNNDLLLVDVHQWHGNTEIQRNSEEDLRVSYVMYYRENMIHCDTPTNELLKMQNRPIK